MDAHGRGVFWLDMVAGVERACRCRPCWGFPGRGGREGRGARVAGLVVRESVTLAGVAERAWGAREFVRSVLGTGHLCGDDALLLVSDSLNLTICLLCLFGGFSGSGLPGFRDRLCGSCGG